MNNERGDLTRTVLAIVCILLLTIASLWIMLPFAAALVWATTIVVSTWPIFGFFRRLFGNRRRPAVLVMTLLLLLLIVIPLWLAFSTIAEHSDQVVGMAQKLKSGGFPPPPEWVSGVPLVGAKLHARLSAWAAEGPTGQAAKLAPYVDDAVRWLIAKAGSLGVTLIQLLLVVIVSAILYSNGEIAALGVKRFGRRLAGPRGEQSVVLAGNSIRGVALGVGVTAVLQAVLGGIGLAIAGIPGAGVLTAVILVLCLAQLGPGILLFSVVAWMYWKGDNGWATFLLIWSIVVVGLETFLRPVLIRRGADLPILLIIAGVLGGIFAAGLIGIFVGPVVLAVTYTLLKAWIDDELGPAPDLEQRAPGAAPAAASVAP
jgi:predicted PurR-regulated permease PerM